MNYTILRTTKAVELNADWNKSCWKSVSPIELRNFMGSRPVHFPKVQARLLYDDANIYVIFRVEDNYIRAVRTEHNDSVCRDSCVEFFFTPGPDISKGYFNVEMNCIGTMLLYHQTARGENVVPVAAEDGIKIRRCSTLNGVIDPEILKPTTWLVEYAVPYSMLEKYAAVVRPAKDVIWHANFYKCADETSHPHWLTWNKVDLPKPDFHRPEFFGEIKFA